MNGHCSARQIIVLKRRTRVSGQMPSTVAVLVRREIRGQDVRFAVRRVTATNKRRGQIENVANREDRSRSKSDSRDTGACAGGYPAPSSGSRCSRASPSAGLPLDRTRIDGERVRLGCSNGRVLMLADPLVVVAKLADVFDELRIPYLVGGSLASSVYGIPRATNDVDLLADVKRPHLHPLQKGSRGRFLRRRRVDRRGNSRPKLV